MKHKTITEIRRARLSDLDTIVAANAALAAETEAITLDRRRLRRGVKALLSHPSRGFYLVAERNGAVVGQLMVTYEWSDWRNGVFWWLQSVYVAPEHRRSGVTRALFKRLRALARGKNVCGFRVYVDKHNTTGRKTYEALGMKLANYDFYQIDSVLPVRHAR